ncbi:Na/Pi cotransporter family protein [Polymorphum gilvum]|nr:Na/Pi symporter [Polymorphum gilvum]
MILSVLTALGGVGLFLLGMEMLTEGLRALAGNALRRFLQRFTSTPLRGVVAGTFMTALLQSSSATTVAAVGFVGAGLLSFTQALGVIFGANIGTTMTAWVIAVLGFKLQLGTLAMPLVMIGIMLKMFAQGRWTHIGQSLAGFSLLFIGLDVMQQGLAALEGSFTPDDFPPDTLLGRLQLILAGAAISGITQASAAGIAAAMAAMSAGTISFPQAAALVIGMNVGTTVTAVLAGLGGSVAMRRTAYAHLVFNLLTGAIAFLLLIPLHHTIEVLTAGDTPAEAQMALAGFHTVFNVLGVLLIIGLVRPFAQFVIRLVPDRGPNLTGTLDDRLLADPPAALDALQAATANTASTLFSLLETRLRDRSAASPRREMLEIKSALEEIGRFAERIKTPPNQAAVHAIHMAAIHTIDHLDRLSERCAQTDRIYTVVATPELAKRGEELRQALRDFVAQGVAGADEDRANRLRKRLREDRHALRETIVLKAAEGELAASEATARLDAIRWAHRVSYHVWRIIHHQKAIAEAHARPVQPGPRLGETIEEEL